MISFYTPCTYIAINENDIDREGVKNAAFLLNKSFYIINIGYLITSSVNFINNIIFTFDFYFCIIIFYNFFNSIYINERSL